MSLQVILTLLALPIGPLLIWFTVSQVKSNTVPHAACLFIGFIFTVFIFLFAFIGPVQSSYSRIHGDQICVESIAERKIITTQVGDYRRVYKERSGRINNDTRFYLVEHYNILGLPINDTHMVSEYEKKSK